MTRPPGYRTAGSNQYRKRGRVTAASVSTEEVAAAFAPDSDTAWQWAFPDRHNPTEEFHAAGYNDAVAAHNELVGMPPRTTPADWRDIQRSGIAVGVDPDTEPELRSTWAHLVTEFGPVDYIDVRYNGNACLGIRVDGNDYWVDTDGLLVEHTAEQVAEHRGWDTNTQNRFADTVHSLVNRWERVLSLYGQRGLGSLAFRAVHEQWFRT